jgi:hypothetical protein
MSAQFGKKFADIAHKSFVGAVVLFSAYAAVNFTLLGADTVRRFKANRVRPFFFVPPLRNVICLF